VDHTDEIVYDTIGIVVAIPEPWGSFLDAARARAGDPAAAHTRAHLTLLGPTPIKATWRAEIEAHLARVARRRRPFQVHLRGTGTFRPVTDVVFVAVEEGAKQCIRLAAAIRAGHLGQELPYPYHPHVTVAHDVPPGQLDAAFAELADFDARFTIDHFTLYEADGDGSWRHQRDFRLTARPAGGDRRG
jgi:2'-5' RNA ligase